MRYFSNNFKLMATVFALDKDKGKGVKIAAVAKALNLPNGSVSAAMWALAKDGSLVKQPRNGYYSLSQVGLGRLPKDNENTGLHADLKEFMDNVVSGRYEQAEDGLEPIVIEEEEIPVATTAFEAASALDKLIDENVALRAALEHAQAVIAEALGGEL